MLSKVTTTRSRSTSSTLDNRPQITKFLSLDNSQKQHIKGLCDKIIIAQHLAKFGAKPITAEKILELLRQIDNGFSATEADTLLSFCQIDDVPLDDSNLDPTKNIEELHMLLDIVAEIDGNQTNNNITANMRKDYSPQLSSLFQQMGVSYDSSLFIRLNDTPTDISRLDLSGLDISGANLDQFTMDNTSFRHCNLSGVNMRISQLDGADFTGASIVACDLMGTHLDGANLENVTIKATNLRDTILDHVHLKGARLIALDLSTIQSAVAVKFNQVAVFDNVAIADIRGGDEANMLARNNSSTPFAGADFSGMNFSGKELRGTNMSGAKFNNTNFTGANLQGSKFVNCQLNNAILRGAMLHYGDFRKSKLTNTDMSNSDLTGANFAEVNMSGANLSGVTLNNTNFEKADLSSVDLSDTKRDGGSLGLEGTNLGDARLMKFSFDDVVLFGTKLSGTDLSTCSFRGAIFNEDEYQPAILEGSDLSGLDLSHKNLRNMDLSGCDLSNTNLNGADLRGTNLANTNLKDTKLAFAKLDTETNLPKSLQDANLQNTNLSTAQLPEDLKFDSSTLPISCYLTAAQRAKHVIENS